MFYLMMCEKMCGVHKAAAALVFIGAINWGLVGLLSFNLVDSIFGVGSVVARIIYVLVGVSAIAMIGKMNCKMCKMAK